MNVTFCFRYYCALGCVFSFELHDIKQESWSIVLLAIVCKQITHTHLSCLHSCKSYFGDPRTVCCQLLCLYVSLL
jgi:hypothetical protein